VSTLARALSAVPDYDRLTGALAAIDAHRPSLAPPASDPTTDLEAEVRDAILDGKPPPADLGARLVAAEDAQRHRTAAATFLGVRVAGRGTGLYGVLMIERDEALRRHADDALAVLADELAAILDDVRGADSVLGPIASAEQAVQAGAEAGAAWRTLTDAVARYDELRAAQQQVLVAAGHEVARIRSDLEDGGYHRDASTIDPRWRARIDGTEHEFTAAAYAARSGWPAALPTQGAGPWPSRDRPSYLRWLSTTADVRPWVPDRRQLAAQLDALNAAVQAAAAERARPSTGQERALAVAAVESARARH
jgi:hypothetical protein